MKKIITRLISEFFRDITSLGGTPFYLLVLLSVFLLGLFSLFFQLLFGFVFTFGVVVLIRTFYFKKRPEPKQVHNFIERIDAASFPSWHSARIVFMALQFMYFLQNRYLTTLLAVMALLVSYSRINLRQHDWWDVIGGAVLGIISYWIVGVVF